MRFSRAVTRVAGPAVLAHYASATNCGAFAAPQAFCVPMASASVRHGFGFGKSSKGEKSRLTQEERRKRRMKSPDEKRATQEAIEAAENFAEREFPEDVDAVVEDKLQIAKDALLKLQNPVLALEKVTFEVGGAKRPLVQLGSIVRLSPKELLLTPHDHAHQTLLISKLARYDSALNPTKHEDKVKLTVQHVTRERREETAAFIHGALAELQKRAQLLRRHGVNTIDDLKLPSTDMSQGLQDQIIGTLDEKMTEAAEKFQELADEALALEDDEVEEVEAKDNV
uniref:Ribosome recycling factor domain-containing protein n=1 Tax=Neobodo designis TaxID=312471 RepID=A0A7S1QF81_NEODS|mmetsp:Transcript_41654/g.128686  ORF Transcript_41654/g.128686 Transcript_41654/m.128686 type:complete len:283 (+) Transcript_41654:84-932(+)|eukprot:CAMPEP_0174832456 /NCGR_PEP_ID=MMETSP1114-20130205/3686_1 /TAXON_ID=312471 /ORGANISM="Neobodo designis, Strain CCAP 1951/1" /LENGTH=282 /DNA_ID=CAMNT_0016066315 /DNA_START=85 /DNA_END=933 /DNA_ORIENTATION=-